MIQVGRQGRWGAVGCLQDPEIGRGRTTAPAGERRGARGRSPQRFQHSVARPSRDGMRGGKIKISVETLLYYAFRRLGLDTHFAPGPTNSLVVERCRGRRIGRWLRTPRREWRAEA